MIFCAGYQNPWSGGAGFERSGAERTAPAPLRSIYLFILRSTAPKLSKRCLNTLLEVLEQYVSVQSPFQQVFAKNKLKNCKKNQNFDKFPLRSNFFRENRSTAPLRSKKIRRIWTLILCKIDGSVKLTNCQSSINERQIINPSCRYKINTKFCFDKRSSNYCIFTKIGRLPKIVLQILIAFFPLHSLFAKKTF